MAASDGEQSFSSSYVPIELIQMEVKLCSGHGEELLVQIKASQRALDQSFLALI